MCLMLYTVLVAGYLGMLMVHSLVLNDLVSCPCYHFLLPDPSRIGGFFQDFCWGSSD
jgi:hypothetical protein